MQSTRCCSSAGQPSQKRGRPLQRLQTTSTARSKLAPCEEGRAAMPPRDTKNSNCTSQKATVESNSTRHRAQHHLDTHERINSLGGGARHWRWVRDHNYLVSGQANVPAYLEQRERRHWDGDGDVVVDRGHPRSAPHRPPPTHTHTHTSPLFTSVSKQQPLV